MKLHSSQKIHSTLFNLTRANSDWFIVYVSYGAIEVRICTNVVTTASQGKVFTCNVRLTSFISCARSFKRRTHSPSLARSRLISSWLARRASWSSVRRGGALLGRLLGWSNDEALEVQGNCGLVILPLLRSSYYPATQSVQSCHGWQHQCLSWMRRQPQCSRDQINVFRLFRTNELKWEMPCMKIDGCGLDAEYRLHPSDTSILLHPKTSVTSLWRQDVNINKTLENWCKIHHLHLDERHYRGKIPWHNISRASDVWRINS